jgi:hypothetical protein
MLAYSCRSVEVKGLIEAPRGLRRGTDPSIKNRRMVLPTRHRECGCGNHLPGLVVRWNRRTLVRCCASYCPAQLRGSQHSSDCDLGRQQRRYTGGSARTPNLSAQARWHDLPAMHTHMSCGTEHHHVLLRIIFCVALMLCMVDLKVHPRAPWFFHERLRHGIHADKASAY